MPRKPLAAVLVLVVLGSAAWIWHTTIRGADADSPGGYPLVCTHCDYFFTLDEDELYSHPRGPAGEGFRCEKCGRFGAKVATRCERCGHWSVMEPDAGGTTSCPKCPKPQN